MRHAGISIGKIGGAALALLALAACSMAAPAPDGGAQAPRGAFDADDADYAGAFLPTGELLVRRVAAPFSYADGAEAKRAANGFCGPDGVASGPADNFREGAWVFPGGCA